MNTVTISGYLQSDVKIAKSQAGKDWGSFTLCNKTGYGNFANTNFFNCVCFGTVAQNLSKYKKKGDYIYVVGEVNIKEYEKDGVKKSTVQITVNNVDFPPVTKVEANDITRTYDQEFDSVASFLESENDFAKSTGLDGTINQKQLDKSKEKPYIDAFENFKPKSNIDDGSLPF